MGLDTSHDAWSGSYSSFNEWRREVARVAGFGKLSDYQGHGGDKSWDAPPTAYNWLVPLLHHSDCDGEISPRDCVGIGFALVVLAPRMPEGWLRQKTVEFAAGCRRAAAANEPLEFH